MDGSYQRIGSADQWMHAYNSPSWLVGLQLIWNIRGYISIQLLVVLLPSYPSPQFYCDDTLWSSKSKVRVTPAVPARVLPVRLIRRIDLSDTYTHTLQGSSHNSITYRNQRTYFHGDHPTAEKSHTSIYPQSHI